MNMLGVDRRNSTRSILLNFRHITAGMIIGLMLLSFSSSINQAVAGDSIFVNTKVTFSQDGTPLSVSENNSTTVYPLHTNITATVFWIGEPVGNGSSEDNALSAYDDEWLAHYGGFDEYRYRRTPENNYFPPDFYPEENPFYLDLPYDDLNVTANRNNRTQVIPWAIGKTDPGDSYSFMKNRWVRLEKNGRICYGQNEDAGPYVYNDANYVFGTQDQRPKSTLANNAGLDVSPALRDCLGFKDLNSDSDKVNWQFVDDEDVPDGPWKIVVTTSGVDQGGVSAPTPANINLISNSGFNGGENGWNFYSIPQHAVNTGVLNTNANGGNAVWQYTGDNVPKNTPLEVQIDLNNSDVTGGSKQVKVVLHNNTWTDWMVCDFILPAGNPGLQTHILRGTTAVNWNDIGIDIYDYTSNGWAWLQMDNVSVKRLETLSSTLPSCQSPTATQNINLALNGAFNSPYLNAVDSWGIFGVDSHAVTGDVLNYNATLNSANAIFQLTGKSLPTGAPLELTLDMNNTSTQSKLIGVVIHDHTFSEYFSCVFLVPGDNPGLHTYTVRNTTTRQWGNVWVDIYDWTRNGQGFMQIDNVSLQWRPELDTSLHCQSPTAPANTNIVRNGTFNSSDTEWTFYNVSDRNVSSGVLNANASPGGNAIYQPFGYSFPINAPIEATFDLNVSASGSKNIRAVVHDELWGEYFVCVFTIPGGNPGLQTYSIRGRTTRIWGHAYIDIYDDTANGQPHLQYDNISVQHNTGINPTGTECTSSGSMIAFDLPLIRVEAESSIPEQQGNWTQYPSDAASGGAYIYSSGTSDDTLTLHFTGTQINIMYVLHPSLGTMAVEIDGITVETLNLAAAQNFGESLLIDNLSTGGHTLRVYAQNGIIAVDTFEIPGG